MKIKFLLMGFLLAQGVFPSDLTLKTQRKNDLTKLKSLYSSKLDADVIESYYYDMNECDIHATSEALGEVVKEIEENEEAQTQTNIDSTLQALQEYSTKLQTQFLNSDDVAVADIIDGADIIVRVFACPISQAENKMFEIEQFPKPEENFPLDFKVRYLSASYWKSSKTRHHWNASGPNPFCGIIFNSKSVEIIAGSPGDAYTSTNYETRRESGILTEQVREMKITNPGNYIKRYNQNLQNYINSKLYYGQNVKMNEDFCKKYESIFDPDTVPTYPTAVISSRLCGATKNRLDKETLLEYVAASKNMNEVVIAPDANDVIGFFVLPDTSKNSMFSKEINQAVDDTIAMAKIFNKIFNRSVRAFQCVEEDCSKLVLNRADIDFNKVI